MPIYTTWEPQGCYKRMIGKITLSDLLTHAQEFASDPRFLRVRYDIFHYLEGSELDLRDEEYDEVVQSEKDLMIPARKIIWVVVTNSQHIVKHLHNLYFDNPILICKSMPEARTYITSILDHSYSASAIEAVTAQLIANNTADNFYFKH